MHLGYVGIRITNLKRSLKFYTELLDLKEVGKRDFTKYEAGIWLKLKEDEKSGQHLELNWYPKGSHFDVPHVAGEGLDHIRFAVDNIEETYKKLLEKGAEPKPIDHSLTEGWLAHVKDPDGNWIEIFKIPPSQAAK